MCVYILISKWKTKENKIKEKKRRKARYIYQLSPTLGICCLVPFPSAQRTLVTDLEANDLAENSFSTTCGPKQCGPEYAQLKVIIEVRKMSGTFWGREHVFERLKWWTGMPLGMLSLHTGLAKNK